MTTPETPRDACACGARHPSRQGIICSLAPGHENETPPRAWHENLWWQLRWPPAPAEPATTGGPPDDAITVRAVTKTEDALLDDIVALGAEVASLRRERDEARERAEGLDDALGCQTRNFLAATEATRRAESRRRALEGALWGLLAWYGAVAVVDFPPHDYATCRVEGEDTGNAGRGCDGCRFNRALIAARAALAEHGAGGDDEGGGR